MSGQFGKSSYEKGIEDGRKSIKEEILNILKKPKQNADLSWEYCDLRFIEEIEDL